MSTYTEQAMLESLSRPADPRRLLRATPEGRKAWDDFEVALGEVMRQLQIATVKCLAPVLAEPIVAEAEKQR